MVQASETYIGSGAHRPTPTITARLNFHLAFGARVGQRLSEATRRGAGRAATEDTTRAPGTALALRNKDLELKSFYRAVVRGARHLARHQRIGRATSSAARRAG